MALTLQQVRTLPAFADMSDSDIISHASSNGFDTSAMIPDTSNEAGTFRSNISIPLLKGAGDIGGSIGYGLEAVGLSKAGQYLQNSNEELQKTLTARQSQQAQADAQKTLIDDNGNYGGYNLGTLSQDVFGSLPGTIAMGVAGAPLAKVASLGSKALGLGSKIAEISSSGALGKGLAAGLKAATIDTTLGSAVGFGASEGIYSGASNAAQIQTQIRNTDINTLAEHPLFADVYHKETDPSLTPDERLQQTRDILATKAGDDVFANTAIQTGLISMATGGGVFGMLRGKALAKDGVKDGVLKTAAKGFALEGIGQEAPQSALEQRTNNQALKDYALPNQDINQGVLNAGLQGGIAGGVMGLMGGAGGSPQVAPPADKKQQTDVNLYNNLDLRTDEQKAQDNASVIDTDPVINQDQAIQTDLQGTPNTADAAYSLQSENLNGGQESTSETQNANAQEEGLLGTVASEQLGATSLVDNVQNDPLISVIDRNTGTAFHVLQSDLESDKDRLTKHSVTTGKRLLTPILRQDIVDEQTYQQELADQQQRQDEQANQQTETQAQDQTSADQSTAVTFQPTQTLAESAPRPEPISKEAFNKLSEEEQNKHLGSRYNEGYGGQFTIGDKVISEEHGPGVIKTGGGRSKWVVNFDSGVEANVPDNTLDIKEVQNSYATAPLLNKRTNQPFTTQKLAEAAIASSSNPTVNQQDHIAVPVDGGFGIVPKPNTTQGNNDTATETQSVLSNPITNATGVTASAPNDVAGQASNATAQEVAKTSEPVNKNSLPDDFTFVENQIKKQKTNIRILANAIEKNKTNGDVNLKDKVDAIEKHKVAENRLRKMRQTVFTASDAAYQVAETGDISYFEEHKDLFPDANKALAELVSKYKAPAQETTNSTGKKNLQVDENIQSRNDYYQNDLAKPLPIQRAEIEKKNNLSGIAQDKLSKIKPVVINGITYYAAEERDPAIKGAQYQLYDAYDNRVNSAIRPDGKFIGINTSQQTLNNFIKHLETLNGYELKDSYHFDNYKAPAQETANTIHDTADVSKKSENVDITHANQRIYQKDYKEGTRFLVETNDNRERRLSGDRNRGGDSIFDTLDEAKNYAEEQKTRDDETANNNKNQAEKDTIAQEQKVINDDTNGFADQLKPHFKALVIKRLNEKANIGGTVDTVKNHVKSLVAKGELPNTRQEDKVKEVSRTQFNRMNNEQQQAHALKIKEAGEKTIYSVGGYNLGKTAYEYAQHLVNKKQTGDTAKPEWHIDIPEQGLAILPAELKGEGYRTVAGRIAKDAVEAITQNQKIANDTLYLYILPAAENYNAIARYFPEDQKPGGSWQIADSQGVRAGSLTNDQLLYKTESIMGNKPILGWEKTSTDAVNVIGKGNSGDVTRIDNEVEKNATGNEAKVYELLKGVEGVAKGYEHDGKIRLPFYEHIISIDTIPKDDRESLGSLVSKNKDRIISAVNSLTNIGYDYNDPLQFGMNKDQQFDLLDFSMAENNSPKEVRNNNLNRLSSFFKQFGAEKIGKAISHVANVLTEQKFQAQYPDMAYTTHEGIDYPALTERLGGKVATHAYYATNARYIQLKDTGIAQTELVNGIKVILSNHAISESDIKQWEMTSVVYGSTTKQEKVAQAVKPALGKYIQPKATASAEDQKRLANRGSRIATLSGLNEAVRKSNPDHAYSDSEIQSAADEKIDEGIDWLISKQQPTKKLTTKGTVVADKAESNIQDFGEKLEGAKKFTYTFKEALAEDIDISAVPLSKSFPQPDYEKLIAGGIDPQVAALIAQLRAEIPTKPSKSYRVSKWVAQVAAIREAADHLLNGDLTVERFIQAGKDKDNYTKYMGDVLAIADSILPSQIRELGNFKLTYSLYGLHSGVKDVWKWSVVNTASKSSWGKQFDTKEEAIAYIKSEISTENAKGESIAKFDRWTEPGKPGVVFVGKKIASGKYITLKEFPTSKEALNYTIEHNAELVELLKQKKKDKGVRRAENNQRVGKDYRNGKNVSAKEFTDTFGFRGVQFGNWVENDRRQQDLNNAYDGLIDLAEVLGIPPKALALNGELGLAFGARGSGGENAAAAHYESNSVVINLTKKNGAGSLAHEWWHAVDNYFGKQESDGFLSDKGARRAQILEGNKYRESTDSDFAVRKEVFDAWQGVTKAIRTETQLVRRSVIKDKTRSKNYYATITEMTARSFERYVIGKLEDQGYSNDYLANIIPESTIDAQEKIEESDYPFPLQSEMAAVNKAYDKLFDTLETKETDKGTALFSKSTTPVVNPHSKTSLNQAVTKAMDTLFGQGWTNRLMATGKFKMISAAEATGLIGKNAMFHKVWHGSPHDHNKFDSAYIDTGEGAQAFGWGHYFSDLKTVAEWYRDKLSNKELGSFSFTKNGKTLQGTEALEEYFKPGRIINRWPGGKDEVIAFNKNDSGWNWSVTVKELENQFGKKPDLYEAKPRTHSTQPDANEVAKILSAEGWTVSKGKLYEVDLAPNQNEYLDWNKPLGEQSKIVRDAIEKAVTTDNMQGHDNDTLSKSDIANFTGKEIYHAVVAAEYMEEDASNYLHSLGIRGVRYKAEAGRSETTSNYVIFNDADIKIEVKYSKNGDVIAFYNPADDTTYLVHDNITQNTSAKALQGLMLHEIGVHALTLGKSNEVFKDILRRFEALKKTNPKVQAAFNRVPKGTKAEDIVEEALAYYLEENPKSSLAQRIVEWFRQAVRALGKALPVLERAKFSQWANKLTEAELIGMATSALKSAPDSLQFDNVGRQKENIKLEQQQQRFYSALRKAFRDAPDKVFGNPEQVKLWIAGNSAKFDVKKDEIYWSGINDWLGMQTGKVSKADVLNYLDQNGVQVEDVMLGGIENYMNDVLKGTGYSAEIEHDEVMFSDEDGEYVGFSDLPKELQKKLNKTPEESKHGEGSLVIPGGRDYKELVVTIPTTEKFNESDSTHFGDVGKGKQIAWLRMNTRTDANGKESLFLEEVQSQRGQQGRTKGFTNKNTIIPSRESYTAKLIDEHKYEVWQDDTLVGVYEDFNADHAIDYAISLQRLRSDPSIPPAPFVTDSNNKATNAYISLLLKKAISHAIDNGHVSVSWTTGDQQADRYELSKQLDKLTIKRDAYGTYDIDGIKDGELVVGKVNVEEEELASIVGKDISEKAIAGQTVFEGDGLKVGGAWTQAMYGDENGLNAQGKPSMIMQAAMEIARKMGGEVGSVEIGAKPRAMKVESIRDGGYYAVVDSETNESLSEEVNAADYAFEDLAKLRKSEVLQSKQPALIITPAMKAKILNEGMPLFSKAKVENSQSNNIKFSRSTPSNTPADNSAMRSFFAPAKGKQALGWLAGLFQRNHLIDFVAQDLPELINYKLLSQQKDNFTNQRENEIGKSYKEMLDKLDKKTMHELGRVQGMATRLVKFDPALADNDTPMTEEELAAYDAYTAMPESAKEAYATMRKAYQDDLTEKKNALIERIKAFPADKETQAEIIRTIEKHFDQFKEGVYFPLNRDGAIIVKATNQDGELVIEHVATQADAYKLVKEMTAQGYDNTHIIGKDAYDRDLLAGNAANEMAALAHKTISDLKEKSVQGKLTESDFNDLFSEFNQLLINTLPDSSYRKHFIHRKGTLGESTDTLRAYAKTRTSAVKMIASLTYDHQIQDVLNNADKAIKEMDKVAGSDTLAIKSIVNELKLREAALKSTEINAVSQVLTSLGFMGALGFNIGSAAVNMLQVVGVALPELSGRHGYIEATKEVSAAYKLLFNPANLDKASGLDITKNPHLTAIAKQAMEYLVRIGKIDLTMTHDSIAAGKDPSYSSNSATRAFGAAAKYSGYFFHVAEAANRQITGMAAFNLAYKKNGGNFEAAIAEAVDVIDRTQFDYGQGNRARYMMSNTARVLTLFKAYALGMSYYIGRNAMLSMKGETPEVRRQARKTLIASMAMSFATAGLFGMPIGIEAFAGIGGVAAFKYKGAKFAVPGAIGGMLIFQALLAGLGADDEDELETEFRNWLTDNFDQTTAEWVTKGPARLLPIGDIAGRTSLSELWWRSQNKQLEGTDQYNAIATALIGPIGSQIAGLFTAKKMYEDGQYSRMVESMSPAFLRNAIAANRMGSEGVTNLKGDKIIQRDLTPVELINKVIGFNPTVVTNTYDANSAIAKESTKHTLAKSHLTNRWISGDATERSDLMKGAIKDFNESVPPSERITLKSLFKSMRSRKGIDKHTKNGLYLSKKQNYLRDIGRFNRQE